MEEIISIVKKHRNSEIKNIVEQRMQEFESLRKDHDKVFSELCFCLLTANFSADGGIKIQNALGDRIHEISQEELASDLASLGHRFPNKRAEFICLAREHKDLLKEVLKNSSENEIREWLAKNIKGLGMKEASHFLRNIGFKNIAIVDFHIVDLLAKHELIEKPKNRSITPKKYLEIESVLKRLAEATNTHLGELDLYLWYEETGKILK